MFRGAFEKVSCLNSLNSLNFSTYLADDLVYIAKRLFVVQGYVCLIMVAWHSVFGYECSHMAGWVLRNL